MLQFFMTNKTRVFLSRTFKSIVWEREQCCVKSKIPDFFLPRKLSLEEVYVFSKSVESKGGKFVLRNFKCTVTDNYTFTDNKIREIHVKCLVKIIFV